MSLRRGAFCLFAVALSSIPVLASGSSPTGINIGFDFNWSYSGPNGYTASDIQTVTATGATLNNCAGFLSATSQGCNFAFGYSIGGVPQTGVAPGGVYNTWGSGSGTLCNANPAYSAPLTMYNCFNLNSFGQIFLAGFSGALSGVTMQMTCLNPSGTAPTGLVALIYQVNPSGVGSIGTAPLAQANVNLSACPTATTWTGHTFSSSDFAAIPLNFTGVNVTAGNFYGIYFGGSLVPGSQLPGISTTPAPGSFILVLIALSIMGWLYRNRVLKTSVE